MNLVRTSTTLLAVSLMAATPRPHPGHSSFAEVSVDAKRQELQVSLGMLAIDFEATLSRRTGKRVNLDKTKGIEKIIEAYLADRFVVTLASGTRPAPHFVGREDKGKNVWIHFTVPLVAKQKAAEPTKARPKAAPPKASLLNGIRLRNRVLMEHNREQRNLVELREGRWRRFLTFLETTQEQMLRPKPSGKTKDKAKGKGNDTGKPPKQRKPANRPPASDRRPTRPDTPERGKVVPPVPHKQ